MYPFLIGLAVIVALFCVAHLCRCHVDEVCAPDLDEPESLGLVREPYDWERMA